MNLIAFFIRLIGNFFSYINKKNKLKRHKNSIWDNDFFWAHATSTSEVNSAFSTSMGILFAMRGINKRITNPLDLDSKYRELNYGDVICVPRKDGIYIHYGIYKNNNEVIHFAAENKDFGSNIKIHITTLDDFLNEDKIFFAMRFYDYHPVFYYCCFEMKNGKVEYVPYEYSKNYADDIDLKMMDSFNELNVGTYFSPEETVKRAEKYLNNIKFAKYDIVLNNCEHFALWCKTGKDISIQTEKAINRFVAGTMKIGNFRMY